MDIEEALQFALSKNGYSQFRLNQKIVIEQYLKGRDVLFCSPTGSGKRLVFEVAPFLFQYLEKTQKCTCIIISPLSALMKSQVEKLTNKNIKAVYLKDKESKLSEDKVSESLLRSVESGDYELVFASPESHLHSNRDIVMKLARMGCLKVIFVDEAHCIKKF